MESITDLPSSVAPPSGAEQNPEPVEASILDLSSIGELMTSSTTMVKIFVGEEKKLWYVHKAIICAKSDYFSKALRGGFQESQLTEIHLEDVDADAFSLFIGWVYGSARIRLPARQGEVKTRAAAEQEAFLYVGLYHLANYLGAEALENLAMDAIVAQYYCRTPTQVRLRPEIVEYIYAWCPWTSPLHDFLITTAVRGSLDSEIFSSGRTYREAVLLSPVRGRCDAKGP